MTTLKTILRKDIGCKQPRNHRQAKYINVPERRLHKRNEVLKQHKKPIWQGSNGRWYTYLPDETKKRGEKLVVKSSEEKLKDTIVDYYKVRNEEQTITFKKMYWHWVEVQKAEVSENTITKYGNDYRRCIQGTSFENLPISDINTEMIRVFIGTRVKEVGLPQRAYTNKPRRVL